MSTYIYIHTRYEDIDIIDIGKFGLLPTAIIGLGEMSRCNMDMYIYNDRYPF